MILVRRKADASLFVIKRIFVDDQSPDDRQEVMNEIRVLAQLAHPNVVGYHGSFIEDGVLNVVMEYADGGSLFQYIQVEMPVHPQTLSRMGGCFLSWPLKRYFSTLVFDTVAHSALSARQPWIRQTFTLTLYERRFASRTGTGSVKSNPQGGTFAKSNLHAPFSTLLQGLSTHERTPPHALS